MICFLVIDLQVAELLACMAKNPQLSCSKIVEVVAETTAPLTPIEKLLEKIPSKRPYVPPPKVLLPLLLLILIISLL